MSGERVKVAALGQTYTHGGAGYGPFAANAEVPFLEVPLAVFVVSGAPQYDGTDPVPEPGNSPETGDPDALKAAHARIAQLERENAALTALLNARPATQEASPAAPSDPQAATPLPDGTAHADLLTQHGFDTLEKLEAGLKVPDGAQKSPVEAIQGIGKKTVEAYARLITDWHTDQAQ